MLELYKKIHDEGTTVVIVTHDMDIVLEYATDVIIMKEGRIVKQTTPISLFTNLEEDYSLEIPLIYQFAKLLNDKGLKIDLTKIRNESDLVNLVIEEKCNA